MNRLAKQFVHHAQDIKVSKCLHAADGECNCFKAVDLLMRASETPEHLRHAWQTKDLLLSR